VNVVEILWVVNVSALTASSVYEGTTVDVVRDVRIDFRMTETTGTWS
jgi:hypothetical protein